jgi:glycosyltransferase involved in cell wall biosynthesis
MAGKAWTPEMRRLVRERHIEASVHELAGVGEEDLRALYSRATLLLFPSLAEGFGWPVIEAQACGCPVVTSDRAPMTEVGGDAARYIDPEDSESAVAGVIDVLKSPNKYRELGLRNAARFSTSHAIQSYLDIYKRIAGEMQPAPVPTGLDAAIPRIPSAV